MKQLVVTNRGRVKRFDVPKGWTDTTPKRQVEDTDYMQEFTAGDNAEIKLSFYYRGARVNGITGKDFLKILAGPPHELSIGEREEAELVIRDASEPDLFEIYALRTDQLNNRKVLVVEGTWLKNRLSNLGIFFDTDGTGTAIQEIHYLAPELEYKKYFQAAIDAIKTIEWK